MKNSTHNMKNLFKRLLGVKLGYHASLSQNCFVRKKLFTVKFHYNLLNDSDL